tara:strand:+ start:411 stop:839 length:429 start_codon:yes stop_codon:yes gene_type:complete
MSRRSRLKMDPSKTPETDLSGFQEQGGYIDQETIDDLQKADKEKKLDRRTISRRNRRIRNANKERLKNLPPDADIQTKGNMKGQPKPEDIFGPDYKGEPTYLNSSTIKNILKYGLPVKSTYSGLAQVGMSGMKFLRLINQLN